MAITLTRDDRIDDFILRWNAPTKEVEDEYREALEQLIKECCGEPSESPEPQKSPLKQAMTGTRFIDL